MEYVESRRLLDTLPRFEVKPGLARIHRLLAHLGRPEWSFPAIHVTGTNGKGSVVAMLSSVLQAAGYRVGRGGGFYDHFLSQIDLCAVRLAPTFDFQIRPAVPRDAHDLPVGIIVSPTKTLRFVR